MLRAEELDIFFFSITRSNQIEDRTAYELLRNFLSFVVANCVQISDLNRKFHSFHMNIYQASFLNNPFEICDPFQCIDILFIIELYF